MFIHQISLLEHTIVVFKDKSLRFLVSVRVASDHLRIGIFYFLLLRNDVQLQPKLLDRLEFCRVVF